MTDKFDKTFHNFKQKNGKRHKNKSEETWKINKEIQTYSIVINGNKQ